MDRELTLEFVRVTESAAIATGRWLGRGNKEMADDAAVTAMRRMFDTPPPRLIVTEGRRLKEWR
jgi:fructose-1,6-bisphosphatase II